MRLFLHLLLSANFTPQEMKWGTLGAGQVATTVADLAHETGIPFGTVKSNLCKLIRTNNISIRGTNRFSIITIVNWALYQSGEQRSTNKPSNKNIGAQPTTYKNLTNKTDSFLLSNKNERNKEELGVNSSENTVPFEEFWSLYPRKEDKLAARKRWEALRPNAALFEKMKAVIEAKRSSDEWRKDNGKFIPMPSTWLHRRRWEDETIATDTGRRTDLDALF